MLRKSISLMVSAGILSIIPPSLSQANSSFLDGTEFQIAGDRHDIDPALLYSVALAESARGSDGNVAPHPYTLRVASEPGFYAENREEMRDQLDIYLKKYKSIDVCAMQVNLRWHSDKINSPYDLLDLNTCLDTGAKILRIAIDSEPNNLALGIGRYYNWKDDYKAANYGRRVLSFYDSIKSEGIH